MEFLPLTTQEAGRHAASLITCCVAQGGVVKRLRGIRPSGALDSGRFAHVRDGPADKARSGRWATMRRPRCGLSAPSARAARHASRSDLLARPSPLTSRLGEKGGRGVTIGLIGPRPCGSVFGPVRGSETRAFARRSRSNFSEPSCWWHWPPSQSSRSCQQTWSTQRCRSTERTSGGVSRLATSGA